MTEQERKRNRAKAAKLKPKPIELPSGKWRCQVMVGGKRRGFTDDDPVAAHAKAIAARAGYLEGEHPEQSMTVGNAIDNYIASKDGILSPSTILGYKRLRKNTLQELMPMEISTLTPKAVQSAFNRMAKEKSPKYVINAYALFNSACRQADRKFDIAITLPQKQRSEVAIPNDEEIRKILVGAKGTRSELPILLALWMGLRASEILGLTWDCIEGDFIHIKQALVEAEGGRALKRTKTYSGDRRIALPSEIKELIDAQPHTDNFIIHSTISIMEKDFAALLSANNLPHYKFHALRHASASVGMALGMPNKYNQNRMGHATDNMLQTVYLHTMQNRVDEYAEKMDEYFRTMRTDLHTELHTEYSKPHD